MGLKLANNAASVLAVSITSSTTMIQLRNGEGSRFPSLSAGDWFPATLVSADGDIEIIRVTGRTGDTLTVERGQEGTLAKTYAPGDIVEMRLTAGASNQFARRDEPNTFSGDVSIAPNGDDTPAWRMAINNDGDYELQRLSPAGTLIESVLKFLSATGVAVFTHAPKVGSEELGGFPSGTRMLFRQSAAPIGWTKITDFDDHALRVVSGTVGSGGLMAFGDVFAARTIEQENLPDIELEGTAGPGGQHGHSMTQYIRVDARGGGSGSNTVYAPQNSTLGGAGGSVDTGTTQSGSHSHAVSVSLGGSGTPMDFDIKYVDVIVAEKD